MKKTRKLILPKAPLVDLGEKDLDRLKELRKELERKKTERERLRLERERLENIRAKELSSLKKHKLKLPMPPKQEAKPIVKKPKLKLPIPLKQEAEPVLKESLTKVPEFKLPAYLDPSKETYKRFEKKFEEGYGLKDIPYEEKEHSVHYVTAGLPRYTKIKQIKKVLPMPELELISYSKSSKMVKQLNKEKEHIYKKLGELEGF